MTAEITAQEEKPSHKKTLTLLTCHTADAQYQTKRKTKIRGTGSKANTGANDEDTGTKMLADSVRSIKAFNDAPCYLCNASFSSGDLRLSLLGDFSRRVHRSLALLVEFATPLLL